MLTAVRSVTNAMLNGVRVETYQATSQLPIKHRLTYLHTFKQHLTWFPSVQREAHRARPDQPIAPTRCSPTRHPSDRLQHDGVAGLLPPSGRVLSGTVRMSMR